MKKDNLYASVFNVNSGYSFSFGVNKLKEIYTEVKKRTSKLDNIKYIKVIPQTEAGKKQMKNDIAEIDKNGNITHLSKQEIIEKYYPEVI